MIRSVEFDLETRSEANGRFASRAGMFAKADRVKTQRAAVRAVLRSHLPVPPPLQALTGNVARPNRTTVRLTRIAPGELDDDNIRQALKAVRDEVAAWIGVDDRSPLVTWEYAQEKGAAHVYRVRLEATDATEGTDRRVVLTETASAGRAASARVRRQVKAAYNPEAGARASSSAAREKAEQTFARLTNKPTALDLRDAYLAVMKGAPGAEQNARAMLPRNPDRDPGEEKAARDVAPCPTCGAAVGVPCVLALPGIAPGAPCLRLLYGVHIARAIAAGLHVPEDDRAALRPARTTQGTRKIVPPAAKPLPPPSAWVVLPWEQPTSGARRLAPMRLATVPDVLTVRVPREHIATHGARVRLTRRRWSSRATGETWLFEPEGTR